MKEINSFQFSVLMSLYINETPKNLEECLSSIMEQTVSPNEIVIVEDGPLTDEMYSTLDRWESKLPLIRVKLSKNVGLGNALNEGLKFCSHDLVARMDTDDLCVPYRFERQLHEFTRRDIDICGSWVSEFESNCDIITTYRKPPESHPKIIEESRLRNPINHPSVMYRKSAILDVGGYDNVLFFEDYHLWLKLIDAGYKFFNIQQPLVLMRAGNAQLSRRGGIKYAIHELSFLKLCSKEKIMSKRYAIRNALIRFPVRIAPTVILGGIYKHIRSRDFYK
ncbi:glycosyltransferase [Vibrio aquimaris]|uniref:UDP-Gal:alpha-D-GlcNAc-diphosphoundecaprenol beta-1,3-galactosyltransferase n=1 Tax=Vibrio aquimaris TaxID=2587862 RepID=A0A5P9CG35_9VIBR|nr:glycosyltransferase [Vibrio aquimaris]QFT25021.1 UDP-Gal:alpha-D-GlcNAc-diphosphoundecaprenol beta-1,3-galactosyltransferase [Vibrio aquimaris]